MDTNKPELRILEWDFDNNEFKILGEISNYISYIYKLNWNSGSTGELKIDPLDEQAKEFIELLNNSTWDGKERDIFIYNLNDSTFREWFKINSTKIENVEDQRTITLSGNNNFFLIDRLTFPSAPNNLTDGKQEITGTIEILAKDFITNNGASFINGTPSNATSGESDEHIRLRTYPYLNFIDGEASFLNQTIKYNRESIESLINKLFKGTLYGYEITIDIPNNKINFKTKTFENKTDIEISQEFNNENGYTIIIDSERKIDAALFFKDSISGITINTQTQTAGRFKEKLISISKQDTPQTLQDKTDQFLVKNNDYKIVDISVIPTTQNPITSRIDIGDIISVKISEGIITLTKESQVKQLLKMSSDDEYKIVPILDDNTESGIKYLSELLRENKENIDSENF